MYHFVKLDNTNKKDNMKTDNFIWIGRHLWSYLIIKDWYEQGSFITDNVYEIPPQIAHLSDEDIDTMINFGILNIYGVEDDKGCCHVNKEDFERYLTYCERTEGLTIVEADRRKRKQACFVIIDYKTPEQDKLFFKRILK